MDELVSKSSQRRWTERILVVDDDNAITASLEKNLEKEGFVDCAINGEEALNKLDADYCAVIVTDVDMPEMDGLEFYKRAIEKYPTIKDRFLFYVEPGSECISFFKKNGLRYLTKDSSMAVVKEAVAEILNKVRF